MEEDVKKDDKKEELVNNSFLNENLKVLEDKEAEFEVNLGTLNKGEEEEYNYEAFAKEEEPVKIEDNQDLVMNDDTTVVTNDTVVVTKNWFDISIIFLVLSFVSMIGLFGGESLRIVGLVISLISLFGSMFMINKRHKYSEVSFSISIILVIVYIVIYVITLTRVDTSVDKEKAKVFKEKALEITERIKEDVLNSKVIKCNARGTTEMKMTISSLDGENSPFGNQYNSDRSYVLVEASENNGECIYQFSIYLTDDNYSLGTIVEPVLLDRILRTDVRKVVREQN